MVLKEKVIPTSTIQIASLPERDVNCPPGKSLVVSGWGRDRTRPYRSTRYLWAVKQECLDMTECPIYKERNRTAPMLCVGDKENYNDACYGDSGGKVE